MITHKQEKINYLLFLIGRLHISYLNVQLHLIGNQTYNNLIKTILQKSPIKNAQLVSKLILEELLQIFLNSLSPKWTNLDLGSLKNNIFKLETILRRKKQLPNFEMGK